MVKNNTAEHTRDTARRMRWPKDDCIRWIEWQIRELTIRSGECVDDRTKWLLQEKAAGGRRLNLGDKVADYAVWLLKMRDGLSWHQIAYRFFPDATEENIEKCESRIRRVFERVERNHPGSTLFQPPRLSEQDKVLLKAVMHWAIPTYVSTANLGPLACGLIPGPTYIPSEEGSEPLLKPGDEKSLKPGFTDTIDSEHAEPPPFQYPLFG